LAIQFTIMHKFHVKFQTFKLLFL